MRKFQIYNFDFFLSFVKSQLKLEKLCAKTQKVSNPAVKSQLALKREINSTHQQLLRRGSQETSEKPNELNKIKLFTPPKYGKFFPSVSSLCLSHLKASFIFLMILRYWNSHMCFMSSGAICHLNWHPRWVCSTFNLRIGMSFQAQDALW